MASVLDACAMIAFLRDEPGGEIVDNRSGLGTTGLSGPCGESMRGVLPLFWNGRARMRHGARLTIFAPWA